MSKYVVESTCHLVSRGEYHLRTKSSSLYKLDCLVWPKSIPSSGGWVGKGLPDRRNRVSF